LAAHGDEGTNPIALISLTTALVSVFVCVLAVLFALIVILGLAPLPCIGAKLTCTSGVLFTLLSLSLFLGSLDALLMDDIASSAWVVSWALACGAVDVVGWAHDELLELELLELLELELVFEVLACFRGSGGGWGMGLGAAALAGAAFCRYCSIVIPMGKWPAMG
jgi:hypothetical protein